MKHAITLVLLLTAGTAFAAAPPSLLVIASFERDHTLPGLSPTLRFSAANTSDHNVEMPKNFALEVTSESGTFIAVWRGGEDRVGSLPATYDTMRVLKVGETVTFEYPSISPAALFDPRMFGPGRYRIRAGFADWLSNAALQPARSLADIPPGTPPLVVTNDVILTIDRPQGQDAAAWQRLSTSSTNAALAREIWTLYPLSRYAAWIATLLVPQSETERVAIVKHATEVDPRSPLALEAPLASAERDAQFSADTMIAERDLDKAITLEEKARSAFEALIDESKSDVVSLEATRQLHDLPTEDQLRKKDRVLSRYDAPPPANARHVVPFAKCVARSGETYLIWFGYDNPNAFAVTMPVGDRNRFAPPPTDRGQPTRFQSGRREKVFSVITDKRTALTWTLDTTAVAADPLRLPSCDDDNKDKEGDH